MDDFPIFSRMEPEAQTRDSLPRKLRAALDDAEALIRLTAGQPGEQLTIARARAERSLMQARAELERVEAEALQRARAAEYGFDDFVHSSPWKAMALAGVLGTVVGVLVAQITSPPRDPDR